MASVASLDMEVGSTDISIDITVCGYSEKASHLFEIGILYIFQQNEKLFAKEIITRQLEMLGKEYRNRGKLVFRCVVERRGKRGEGRGERGGESRKVPY